MNKTLKIEDNDHFLIDNIIKCRRFMSRGIRSPEQILEDMKIEPVEEKEIVSLNY